ncbi:hypothetical protein Q5752_000354 [Cryptotrichosporon argae]
MPFQDPLAVLGPSLFLSTLSFLPLPSLSAAQRVCSQWKAVFDAHPKQIWRRVTREVVDEELLRELDGKADGAVDWKAACKSHARLESNWENGRFKETWFSTHENDVWRFKLDRETGVMFSTSRSTLHGTGGLIAVDIETSERLFAIRDVRPSTHLEFTRGFVVFNHEAGGNHDSVLQVWRTQTAIDRSTRAADGEPELRCVAFVDGAWTATTPDAASPLPKGHLAYFRTLVPPTSCNAFRARVDREFQDGERAVVATAGSDAAYVWDLETGQLLENYGFEEIEELDRGLQYIELDDNYLFVCVITGVLVFSRHTKRFLFPLPGPVNVLEAAGTALSYQRPLNGTRLDASGEDGMLTMLCHLNPCLRCMPRDLGNAAAFKSLVLSGVEEGSLSRVERFGDTRTLVCYSACHFTSRDLILTTRSGFVIIIRDYPVALSRAMGATDPAKHLAILQRHTIWLGLAVPVIQLTTWNDRIALVSDLYVLFLDSNALPAVLDDDATPAELAERHYARIVAPYLTFKIDVQSCLQMDRFGVYMVDSAKDRAFWYARQHMTGMPERPERIYEGEQLCVKMWDLRNDFAHEPEWRTVDAPEVLAPP